MLMDQGYFIIGGKNILIGFGLQWQGILVFMLDVNGMEFWDVSYYIGNVIDNGVSVYYDQVVQQVYVLINILVIYYLGISVFDVVIGVLDNMVFFEFFFINFDLDKYGYIMIKVFFMDKLFIQGWGFDGQWADDEGWGQLVFLVDYDLFIQIFGVYYVEINVLQALNGVSIVVFFFLGVLCIFYYLQLLVNINVQYSVMVFYIGVQGQDVGLIV